MNISCVRALALFFTFLAVLGGGSGTPGFADESEAIELRTRGYEAQQRGDLEEAEKLYKKAIKADASYAAPHNDLGVIYEQEGDAKKAERSYQEAIRLNPNYPAAYTNLGLLYESQGRDAEALDVWKRRAELGAGDDPWRDRARDKVAAIEKRLGAPLAPTSAPPVPASIEKERAKALEAELTRAAPPQPAPPQPAPPQPPRGERFEQVVGGKAYTTVKFTPPRPPGGPAPAGPEGGEREARRGNDWYVRTPQAQSDRAFAEEEEWHLSPETRANAFLLRAQAAIEAKDYQRAIDLLGKARALDPDNVQIEKVYWKARESQIEEDIVRASIDSRVHNRRKIMDVEKAWFPPVPDAVPPFDRGRYIYKGVEKSEARKKLEERSRQVIPAIDFTEAQLKDVIEFLAVSNDINIVLDEKVVPPAETVTVHLKDMPLIEALDIILRTKGLKYRFEENIVWITTAERLLEEDLEVRAYDVQDLVGKLHDFPSEPFDFEKFIQRSPEAAGTKST